MSGTLHKVREHGDIWCTWWAERLYFNAEERLVSSACIHLLDVDPGLHGA